MSMTFFVNSVLTSAGAGLIRDAVAAEKKIVFTRALCGSQYEDQRGDLSAKPKDWYDGASGSVIGVDTSKGNVCAFAAFEAVDDGTDPVKSVCLCAQMAKDGEDPEYDEADDVIFAASSDDNSGFISGYAFGIAFDLPTNALGLVDAGGVVPNGSGLHVSGFESGTLTVVLDNGKTLEISATEQS